MNEITELDPAALNFAFFFFFLFLSGIITQIFLFLRIIYNKNTHDQRVLKAIHKTPWSWFDIGIFLCVLSLMQMATAIISRALFGSDGAVNPQAAFMQTTVLPLGTLILVYEISIRRSWSLEDIFGIKASSLAKDAMKGVVSYLAVFPVFIVGAILYGLALKSIDYPVRHQDVILWFVDANKPEWFKWYLVVMAVVIAPVTEEVLFRGIGLPVMMRHCRTSLAVIFVSVLFTAVHFHVSGAIPLFILAIGLSLAYIYTGSLVVPVVMHSLFNGVMLLATIFMQESMH